VRWLKSLTSDVDQVLWNVNLSTSIAGWRQLVAIAPTELQAIENVASAVSR
jgi:hypothetical protein